MTMLLLLLVLEVTEQAAQPPIVQPQNVRSVVREGLPIRVVTVAFTDAGIRDATFLNGTNPPDLIQLAGEQAVELVFRNESTADATVTLEGYRPLFVPMNEERSLAITRPLSADAGRTIVTFDIKFADGRAIGPGYFAVSGGVSGSVQPVPTPIEAAERRPTAAQSRDPGARIRTLSAPAQQPDDTQYATRVQLNGTGVDDWDFRNSRNPPYLLKISPANAAAIRAFGEAFRKRHLDTNNATVRQEINVVDNAFEKAKTDYQEALKRAKPGEIITPPDNPWDKLALLDRTVLEFSNRSIDRTFSVTFDIPEPAEIKKTGFDPIARANARSKFETDNQVKLGDCTTSPPITCKLVMTAPFDAPKMLRASLFVPRDSDDPNLAFASWFKYLSGSQTPVTFSVNFFDENATPAEATGYVSLVPLPALKEPASKTSWNFSPTISANRDPLVGESTVLSTSHPFPGDIRRQLAGAARLQLKQTLGGRADAVVELAFKSGVLGEKDQTGKVTVPTYQVNINSIPGLRLSFGRFLFASPAQGIASKEQGEGFRLGFRNRFGLSHIVRRESLDGAPDTSNRDNKLLLIEINNIGGRTWRVVRGINVLVTLGQDRAPKTLHAYGSAGFDTSFTVPDSPFAGTLAYYYSLRKPRGDQTDPPIVRGSGHVALGTLGYTLFENVATGKAQVTRKPLASVRMELGRGRGDDLDTERKDEGYLGETASFSPDVFFLSTFAAKLQDIGARSVGLRNKLYIGVVYQEERVTPLDLVARILQIPASDIASRLMRAGVRAYQFNSNLVKDNDRHFAGHEVFGESQIETPAGVRSSLQVAYFRPGDGVRSYFKDRTLWSIVAKVTIVLGS